MSDFVFFLLTTNKLYKKENTKKLKSFPAGYVGSFYRNLADSINTNSDFYSRIAADADIPKEDVQRYILATSDFAKSIQTNIKHYVIRDVTRDTINNASFRQRLDPISKNILRKQNPLELVFEDISTFDAENPVAGSLLTETDIKKNTLTVILLNLCLAIQVTNLRSKEGLIILEVLIEKITIAVIIIIIEETQIFLMVEIYLVYQN